jgi:NAD(P)-dependent dehydrogenase (short-subunit alcohol dehydrogenase family)
MAVRDLDRGEAAAERLRDEGEDGLQVRRLDLADLDAIRTFAETVAERVDRLDFLFNNAGVMAIPREETVDGFEKQLGVNHLGHFALTGHLLPTLLETPGEARVVTQSSGMHERGTIDFEDLQSAIDYDRWGAYAQSKLANVLFAFELQRRLAAAGREDCSSVAVHPGYADTNLQRRGPEKDGSRLRLWLMKAANALVAQSAQAGAWPMLYAATAPEIEGGEYVGPTGLLNLRGPPGIQEPSERARDGGLAERLWEVSRDLTGVAYDVLD